MWATLQGTRCVWLTVGNMALTNSMPLATVKRVPPLSWMLKVCSVLPSFKPLCESRLIVLGILGFYVVLVRNTEESFPGELESFRRQVGALEGAGRGQHVGGALDALVQLDVDRHHDLRHGQQEVQEQSLRGMLLRPPPVGPPQPGGPPMTA